MPCTRSELHARVAVLLPACALLFTSAAVAQQPPAPPGAPVAPQSVRIVSHDVDISRTAALLKLELSDGRTLDAGIRDGQVLLDGKALGNAPRGGDLERSWRELLNEVIDASSDEVPELLTDWSADGTAGEALDQALDNAMSGLGEVAPPAAPAPISDSLQKLQERIAELESQKADMETNRAAREFRTRGNRWERGPFYYLGHGLSRLFSLLMMYIVLFGIGIATILFGGRKYIEGVADTAMHATTRSFMVGIAGAFLTLPAFILGIIALAVSIVGIPALLLWVPLFPVAVVAALLLGYLGVAHMAGEKLAERRFYVTDWFQRGNSYYFLITGLGLLLAFFVGSAVVSMGGPWLGFVSGLLKFLAVMLTWAAFTIGFGAVLISRAGTRPIRPNGRPADPDLFAEADEAGVV